MRRPVKRNRIKLAAESQRLVNLSLAVAQSASRIEDLTWQEKLDLYVSKNLRQHHQEIVDAAAENLFASHPNGYEVLVETLETVSTCSSVEIQGKNSRRYSSRHQCWPGPVLKSHPGRFRLTYCRNSPEN
jgi:hypothetical protein